jgi:aryl-alcohol dehydrogenase-like predicted oxidoreductase
MEQRALGTTGVRVSVLGFGGGSIGGLFVRGAAAEQRRALEEATGAGVSYVDTAPSYGDGESETNLGRVLAETGLPVILGTKVRLADEEIARAPAAIRRSLDASLRRLRRARVDLLQLHNRVVLPGHGAPGALTVDQVLGPVAEGFQAVKDAGLVGHLGFTGMGDTEAVARIVQAGRFETVQIYFNALNPSAGWAGRGPAGSQDFGGLIDRAAVRGLGVIVIRPFAAGAVSGSAQRHPNAGDPGSPLIAGATYAEDLLRAPALADLAREAGLDGPTELALRLVQSKPGVSTVLVGFSDLAQVHDAVRWTQRGALPADLIERVLALSGTGS